MSKMRIHLKKADSLTFLNISFGFAAMVFLLNDNLDVAGRLIFAAVVADGFDGYFARKSKTESEFGMNFDSLSDGISFGVAPALLLYSHIPQWWILPVSFCYLSAGVLRLARYNVSFKELEEDTSVGIPIPIGALLVVLAVYGNLPGAVLASIGLLTSCLMACSVNFTRLATERFPVQNFAILPLMAVPMTYMIPVARIVFAGLLCGIFLMKKRSNS